ncbi:MAG: iron ABC transporter permease [Bacteroidales bacterium]|jgi:iron complex transport system permease protein|nr:iron ABC transporter permease [Bacteroidales bacterium]
MQKSSVYIIIFSALLPLLFCADIVFGSISIPIEQLWNFFSGTDCNTIYATIIANIRIPRALVALLTGLALPVSGLCMQTFFRNPLAGPDILGVSTGASLGVALFSLAGGFGGILASQNFTILSGFGSVACAAAGAMLIMLLILLVAPKIYDTSTLLIIGIMFSSITSAIVSILQYISNPHEIQQFLLWTFGSFSGIQMAHIGIMASIVIPILLITFSMQKSLNALLLGENYARGLGVSIKQLRIMVLLMSSILAAVITAFTGPIGFVGMAIPHIARMTVKTANHKILIPLSALIGANLVLVCDIISQMPGFETALPINVVTSIVCAPVVIFVIFSSRKFQR